MGSIWNIWVIDMIVYGQYMAIIWALYGQYMGNIEVVYKVIYGQCISGIYNRVSINIMLLE
jgi:hypothetical protein